MTELNHATHLLLSPARALSACLFLLVSMVGQPALAVPETAAAPHRVTFAFHSAFLMNLHHFLYDLAVHPEKLAQIPWAATPTPDEMRVLTRAIDFYRANYGALALRDDPVLVAIKRALSVGDAVRDVHGLGLPPALAAVLQEAAPVYARTIWPRDDAANGRWIARAMALDAAYGQDVQAGIEAALAARFPAGPIRVDVVCETGSRQGAYTDEQTVMPGCRLEYQDLASLEMLYHEASHTTVTEPLERAIAARLQAGGRTGDDELWHVVQFYTVGSITRDVLARHGVAGYQPYAERRGLYANVWARYMPAIRQTWDARLDGTRTLAQCVAQLVDALPAD